MMLMDKEVESILVGVADQSTWTAANCWQGVTNIGCWLWDGFQRDFFLHKLINHIVFVAQNCYILFPFP